MKQFLWILAISPWALSGTIEITGRGNAKALPEYATLSVQVVSLCYETSRDANDANGQLASSLVEILKKYATKEKDQVTATGGATIRQTEFISGPGGISKILCERKWRTTNQLTLELNDFQVLPALQDELYAVIDAEGPSAALGAQSYAELSHPNFSLYSETYTRLRKEAQSMSWKDANEQLDTFKTVCEFKNLRLVKISEPEYTMRQKFAADESNPMIPDSLIVYATWHFIWEFDPTPGCRL